MMAPDNSRTKVEKVIGTEMTPEIRALGDYFGSSPLFKSELERGLLPLFAIAARDHKVRLEDVVLPNGNGAVNWYHNYCHIGGSNYDSIPITHDDFVTVTKENELRLTADGASWMRDRISRAITIGASNLENFGSV